MAKPPKKSVNKRVRPKFTDAERHKRFVETAKTVEASEDHKDFDKAFKRVVKSSVR